jgi:hypothetical protein
LSPGAAFGVSLLVIFGVAGALALFPAWGVTVMGRTFFPGASVRAGGASVVNFAYRAASQVARGGGSASAETSSLLKKGAAGGAASAGALSPADATARLKGAQAGVRVPTVFAASGAAAPALGSSAFQSFGAL